MPAQRPPEWSELEADPKWSKLDREQKRTVLANWGGAVASYVTDNGGFNPDTETSFKTTLAGIAEKHDLIPGVGEKTGQWFTDAWHNLSRGALNDFVGGVVEAPLRVAENVLPNDLIDAESAANAVAGFRKAVDEAHPVTPAFAESIPGQVVRGIGQAVPNIALGALRLPGLAAGAVAQSFDQGYQDAVQSGTTPAEAFKSGVANLPGAIPEYYADKVALGGLMRAAKVTPIRRELVKAALTGAASEASQQGYTNFVASDVVGYDQNRELGKDVANSALVGGLTEGIVRGGTSIAENVSARAGHKEFAQQLDTAKNIPESTKTLLLQQDQLRRGLRPAQMFPAGTKPLPLIDGMEQVKNERGVFHYNPEQITGDEILSASREGRENEVLGLGSVSKPAAEARAAQTGEKIVAVTERAADGTEIKTAVGTTGTAAQQAAELNATKSPGSTIKIENPRQSLIERLRAEQAATEQTTVAAALAETTRRDAEKARRDGDKLRFEETLLAANALSLSPDAEWPAVNGALTSLSKFVDDPTYALTQQQKEAALKRIAGLKPRAEQLKVAHDAATAVRDAAAEAAAQAAEKAKREAVRIDQARIDAIDATGRDPTTNKIVQIENLTDDDLAAVGEDLEKNGLTERQYEAELTRRERTQAEEGNRASFTLRDLFVGKREALNAAGLTAPLRLPTPKTETERGGLGGELKTLRESPGAFGFFQNNAPALDRMAQTLRNLGFKVQTENDVVELVGRAFNGKDVRPETEGEVNETQSTMDLGGMSAGLPLPNAIRNLTPRWQNKILRFDSNLDKALYYAGGEGKTETRTATIDHLARETGLSTGQIASLARNLRQKLAPLAANTAADGTLRVPALMENEATKLASPAKPAQPTPGETPAKTSSAAIASYVDANGTSAQKRAEAIKQISAVQAIADNPKLAESDYLQAAGGKNNNKNDADSGTDSDEALRNRGRVDQAAKQERARRALTDPEKMLERALLDDNRISSIIPELVANPRRSWDIRGAVIKTPSDLLALTQILRTPYAETGKIILVNSRNEVVHAEIISIGTTTSTHFAPSHLAQVLARAPKTAEPYGIIVSHNHPSGDPTPSAADMRMTRVFIDAAQSAGHYLLDHVVTNGKRYYSFKETGVIAEPSGATSFTDLAPAARGAEADPDLSANQARAPWEVVAREDLKPINSPYDASVFLATARQVAPDAMHVIYVNRRNQMVSFERIPKAAELSAQALRQRLFESMGREGATGLFVDMPDTFTNETAVKAMRMLRDFALKTDFSLLDVAGKFQGGTHDSARMAGLLAEPEQTRYASVGEEGGAGVNPATAYAPAGSGISRKEGASAKIEALNAKIVNPEAGEKGGVSYATSQRDQDSAVEEPAFTRGELPSVTDSELRAEHDRVVEKLTKQGKQLPLNERHDLQRLRTYIQEEAAKRGLPPLDAPTQAAAPATAAATLKANPPAGVTTAAALEREQAAQAARLSEAAKAQRHPAAIGTTEPGEAWGSAARMTEAELTEERASIAKHLDEYALDLADIEKAHLHGRSDALKAELARRTIDQAQRVTPIPVIDRQAALKTELARGRRLRDEGLRTGNELAEKEGTRIVKAATERLDEEFPKWETTSKPATVKDSLTTESTRTAQASLVEQDDGRARAAFGHSAYTPSFLEKITERVRSIAVGFRGAIPELPAFPALAAKTDRFIRDQGPTFYNNLKAFYRTLSSANDYIQRTAEEQVDAITGPLMKAGPAFDAAAYAQLKQRQEQARRLKAEGKRMPAGAAAELDALQSQLEAHPYVLFNKLVYFMDLDWRSRNLKDSEGNPIKLPDGLNQTELTNEINRLGGLIAASPHAQAIETAFDRHMALVKRTADDLKERDLLAAQHLDNPYYFPHLTLEITRGDKTIERELRPERVRVGTEADFRGYLQEPTGSLKPIESDYVRALYYHLVQVGAHNLKADAIRDHARPYDVRTQVEARAKELSKQRGRSVSWEEVFHSEYAPAGYVLYGTDSRDAFPSVMVDRDKLARRLGEALTSADLHTQLKELGVKGIKLLPEDLKETLVQGQRETWIVPARVAEALRGIADRQQKTSEPIESAIKKINGAWKGWKLFMPQNHIRYEYGNIVADLEKLFSASPRTFKYIGQSAKEMRAFFQGEAPSDDLRAALKDGVINAITAQEMNQLQRLRAFEKFQTVGERMALQLRKRSSSALYQPITNLVGLGDLSSVELSAFREGVTRYANYLANLDAIRNKARPDYAGAYWRDIEAIGDSRPGAGDKAQRQAAQISKATFGDYGDLSTNGQYIRDKLIPFYSWMEVNFKYHANLLRNFRDQVRGDIDGGSSNAAATVARVAGARAGGFALRLALPYAAILLWNAMGPHGVEDDDLSEEDRRRIHIRLGKDANGKPQIIYANTALADITKWFSGAKFAQASTAWLTGKTDFVTALDSWAKDIPSDFMNNTIGSAGPVIKLPATAILKKNFFPDVLDARTIPDYDMRRAIISQMFDDFTADRIEATINKDYMAPKDLGTWAKQLVLQIRQRDPESWAFYGIKDKFSDYIFERTGVSDNSSRNAPDQQVLRNFRKAIYQGDPETAAKFYLRLLDYGYTSERFTASIRAQNPLQVDGATTELRRDFVASLSESDRAQLDRAYQFYVRMSTSKGTEQALFPRKEWGERGQQHYQQSPRVEVLNRTMQRTEAMADEELVARAKWEMKRSLMRN